MQPLMAHWQLPESKPGEETPRGDCERKGTSVDGQQCRKKKGKENRFDEKGFGASYTEESGSCNN